MDKRSSVVSFKKIEESIFVIRGLKVMLDTDLAKLYGVETRVLKQAVKRNQKRFPDDFMFQLTREEIMRISQIVTSSKLDGLVKLLTPVIPAKAGIQN